MSTPLNGASSDSDDSRLTRLAVAKAKAGDADGIHYLYVRYADDVRRYVATFVKDSYEAEDITHNVFAKLMTRIAKYEQREVPLSLAAPHIGGDDNCRRVVIDVECQCRR